MICGFRSVLCVSVFQGSLVVIVIMTDGSDSSVKTTDNIYRRIINLQAN